MSGSAVQRATLIASRASYRQILRAPYTRKLSSQTGRICSHSNASQRTRAGARVLWSKKSSDIVRRMHAGHGIATLYCEHFRPRLSLGFARRLPLLPSAVGHRMIAVRKMAWVTTSNDFLMNEADAARAEWDAESRPAASLARPTG
jgi:hypothetical protein